MAPIVADAPSETVKNYLIARERLSRASARKLNLYLHDPVAFIADCVSFPEGEFLTPYQAEVINDVVEFKRVAQRGPHGLGKSTTAALLVHWFALTRDALGIDWKCPITAGAWRQLERFLMPEIHKWAKALRWDKIGREPYKRDELKMLNLDLNFGSAFAVASNVPAYIEGAHADSILYIFDESKSIINGTFDAAEGAFSGAGAGSSREALALASSTPGEPSGRFYEIHAQKPEFLDWHVRHVTLAEAISAGRIDPDWVEKRKIQWGEDSQIYANRVLGEFKSSDIDSIVPLTWVEAAIERWYETQRMIDEKRIKLCEVERIGVDVARGGEDSTVIARIRGQHVEELRYSRQEDTTMTESRVMAAVGDGETSIITIDADGLGVGVFDHVKKTLGHERVKPFHSAQATNWKDASGELEFANTRAAAWYSLRQMLDPAKGPTLELPDDDQLLGDLSSPKMKPSGSRGKILVESKDDIKKRLGRSTDSADAVIYGLWSTKQRRRRKMGNMGYGQDELTVGERAVQRNSVVSTD